jgi:hypothetical protein
VLLAPAQHEGVARGRGLVGGWRRTEVIVEKSHSAVASEVGVPVGDGLEPF